jgi:ribonucleoside-diphosphate reductase alpha chain
VKLLEPASKPLTVSAEEREGEGDFDDKARSAKAQGYTGAQCEGCGSMKVKQNGSCQVCIDCGETTGCS